MAIIVTTPRALVLSTLLLLPLELTAQTGSAPCQPYPACQAPAQLSSAPSSSVARSLTAQTASTPNPKPKRIIVTDLSAFHLQQQPAPNQVSLGSRGSDSILVLCAPPNGLSSSAHPLFVWRGTIGRVTFDLLDEKGDVLEEFDGSGSSLRYPADAAPLVQGKTYSWKVSGGSTAMDKLPAPVSFKIAAQPPADQLKQAGQDALALAQVYIRSGLWYDSVATLEEALQSDPANKDFAAQLNAVYKALSPSCPVTP